MIYPMKDIRGTELVCTVMTASDVRKIPAIEELTINYPHNESVFRLFNDKLSDPLVSLPVKSALIKGLDQFFENE